MLSGTRTRELVSREIRKKAKLKFGQVQDDSWSDRCKENQDFFALSRGLFASACTWRCKTLNFKYNRRFCGLGNALLYVL